MIYKNIEDIESTIPKDDDIILVASLKGEKMVWKKTTKEKLLSQKTDSEASEEHIHNYNKTQNVYVDGQLLYPVTFFDIDSKGRYYLREDGKGDYLLYIPMDGIPRLKFMGGISATDSVTGSVYDLSISNGVIYLKQDGNEITHGTIQDMMEKVEKIEKIMNIIPGV